jgi:hypothetical protein
MGFYEEMHLQFSNVEMSVDEVTKLSSKDFVKLIGVLNTLFQFSYSPSK